MTLNLSGVMSPVEDDELSVSTVNIICLQYWKDPPLFPMYGNFEIGVVFAYRALDTTSEVRQIRGSDNAVRRLVGGGIF